MSPHTVPTKKNIGGISGVEGTGEPREWLMGKEAFEAVMPHHEGIKALWETKWKFPCTKSLYPFHDGAFSDFEPIFQSLIARNINDGNSAEYTSSFFPTATNLERQADGLLAQGNKAKASELYLRACTVLRIARFPYISSFPEITDKTKWQAWELQKSIYMKAGKTWEFPLEEVIVPHTKAEGRDRKDIPVYIRTPKGKQGPFPTVVLMTGLDGYRPDNTVRCEEFLSRGWAAVVVEIPGTADCPADSADPESPDRLWTSLLDWMAKDGRFDNKKVMVWGLSSGGYYAVRIAHTHKERIIGSVAQGAGVHYFYDSDWLEKADGHEYPFKLTPAMAHKHGFGSVEEYKKGVQKKFSLLEAGLLKRESARLFLINGTLDGLMPIEDSMLLFEHGSPKEARFFMGALHMGYPMANSSVYPWMESVMSSVQGSK
ncbi:Alpha/Beta hydrolase protein [Apiosordaria backusii]|uniref:Alpha/Beta hydrolase protein n=1 Tax=Apiosordaria backusii TaxID=314023 RepID=A0AA40AX77_9PEZI|nr:Alpha/Beta hydrolase protein [Apiosordaria backusii]